MKPPRRIMRLGDSITVGYAQLDGGAFAKEIASLSPWSFVGSVSSPSGGHEGHGGWRIDEIAKALDGWFATSAPTDVALMIGTNDAAMGDASTAPERVKAALAALRALVLRIASKISGRLIVATIPPATGPFAYAVPFTVDFNLGIIEMVKQLAREGLRVQLADVDRAMTTAMISPDGVHPTPAGHRVIGQVFGHALAHPELSVSKSSSGGGVVIALALLLAVAWGSRKRR